MAEEIQMGPAGRGRPALVLGITLGAVTAVLTAVVIAVVALWLTVPRDPHINLEQAHGAYSLRIEQGSETLRWEQARVATRDWVASSQEVIDCSRYKSNSDFLGSSLFAVRLSRTQLLTADGAVLFFGGVGTFGYADTPAASQALIRLEELLRSCKASPSPLYDCTVSSETTRAQSWKARAHFEISCAGFGDRSILDVVQVGNTLTMLEPGEGFDERATRQAAEAVERTLVQA